MDSKEILAWIDSMDLTEDFINDLLNKIMTRTTFSKKHLENALRFLKYKFAVNQEELLACSNNQEYEFVGKVLRDVCPENIDLVCEITNIVLQLDPQSIESKAEHLLQQIFSRNEMPAVHSEPAANEDDSDVPKLLLDLKLSSSILEAVISQNKKVALPFLEVPVENLIFSSNDKIVQYFYSSTFPNFHLGVTGYSITERLWTSLRDVTELMPVTLKVISCLADYYLPVVGSKQKQQNVYTIAVDNQFWEITLFGLQSSDNIFRKRATYLMKRAIEILTDSQKDINIKTEELVMVWDKKNKNALKTMWDNFFILIDSLEESQSNIVLPSLKLFDSVKSLGHCWLSCAYNIGLWHGNASVRLNCILHRLKIKVESNAEAIALLNALNDINLYESPLDSKELLSNISKALEDKDSLMIILGAISNVKWSPVPLYYLSETLSQAVNPSLLLNVDNKKLCSIINDILRIPCNSPVIKKAIIANISNFIINSCKGFGWEEYVTVYPNLHVEMPLTSYIMDSAYTNIKKNLHLSDIDKSGLAAAMTATCENIVIGLIYVSDNEQNGSPFFLEIIDKKVGKIVDICNEPKKYISQCLADVNFLINIYRFTVGRSDPSVVLIKEAVLKNNKVILQYLLSLLTSAVELDIDDVISLFDSLEGMPIIDGFAKDILIEINETSILKVKDKDAPRYKKTIAVSIMNYLFNNYVMDGNHRNNIINLSQFLEIVKDIEKDMNVQGSGKLKSIFYEKTCEIILLYLKEELDDGLVLELFTYVENVLDCGGYGCLKFILQIMNSILHKLIDNSSIAFDLSQFLSQVWVQICELKTNKEYLVCVDNFVKLITQDLLLKHSYHNSVVVRHYASIIDLAASRRMPLYFIVKHLSSKNTLDYDNLIDVLCKILMYAIVPKKEQRITENLAVELFPKMEAILTPDMRVFNQHIQLLSVAMLSKVFDINKLNEISDRLMFEIDQLLKVKPKYYFQDTTHRKMFRAMQSLLFIFLKTRRIDAKKTATWCMNLLRLSHQNDVKICIFWYIALYIYSADITIDLELGSHLADNGVPLIGQFTILYYVMRHKLQARMDYQSEIEFVLDFLLSHSMGPVFSIRLTAQYYAMKLLENTTVIQKIDVKKYSSHISILTKTLGDLVASKDNAFATMRNDYFIQTFDIVGDLTVMFIFHSLQRHTEKCNENVDASFAKKVFDDIEAVLAEEVNDTFYAEWKGSYRHHTFWHYQGLPTPSHVKCVQNEPNMIQKKYVPWWSMSDPDMERFKRGARNVTDLIVVASLLTRLPNLGGLARTCEVFGVSGYVVDNISCLQDKEFQLLSVSAERWVNIEEVRAGGPLKEYLQRKRREGYCIVAAEQTSNSEDLSEFRFPKKTVLVLGNEKEGVPPHLLPLMQHCVEIPQRGVVRSLNVHVSAAVVVWEYSKQHAAGAV